MSMEPLLMTTQQPKSLDSLHSSKLTVRSEANYHNITTAIIGNFSSATTYAVVLDNLLSLIHTIRCFNDLPIRVVDDDATNETSMAIRELSRRLVQCGALTESECNFERMLKLYRTWQTHGFLLYNEGRSEYIGGAIYVLCSIYQHSCRPNAIRVVDESFRMQVILTSVLKRLAICYGSASTYVLLEVIC